MNLITRITRRFNPLIENFTEETSRRQRETFLCLQSNHDVKLKKVTKVGGETVLICEDGISVDYNGLVSWSEQGFYPIEWSPFN